MIKLRNIPHVIVITASLAFSSYIVSNYLIGHLNLILSLLAGITLSSVAHYYLIFSLLKTIKDKRLHQSIILGFVLSGAVFYMEFHGVAEVAHKALVDNSREVKLQDRIADFQNQLAELSTSRKWQDIESKRLIQEQLGSLEKELEVERQRVGKQTEKAERKTNDFRYFSAMMLLLSCIASSCVEHDKKEEETPIPSEYLNNLAETNKEKEQSTQSSDSEQEVEENTEEVLEEIIEKKEDERKELKKFIHNIPSKAVEKEDVNKDEKKTVNEIAMLSQKERINLAVQYIVKTQETEQRFLAKTFALPFKSVKQAKDKAFEILSDKEKVEI